MDFFKEAQKLTNIAKGIVQEGTKNLIEAVEETKNTALTLKTAGEETLEQWKTAPAELIQHSSVTVDQTIHSVKTSVIEITASSVAKVEVLKEQSTKAIQQRFDTIEQAIDTTQLAILEIGVAGTTISNTLKDLPKTAEELAKEMPKIAYRLRNRAGLRSGDTPRSDADVIKLFDKIPGTSKLGANEIKIREFLADKHGSHIISRQQGGSNGANNIVWEIGTDNIRRGARIMTGGEQIYIRFYNAVDSIVKNSGTIAKLGITATGTAIITQAVVTAVSYALDLYRGDITIEEFRDRIIEAAVTTGIATPIFFLIFIAVLALFPELTLLFSAPAVVAGLNALFGISIAIPIIQSLIRHIEAGGFGKEVEEGYQNLVGNAQYPLEPGISET